MKQFSLCLLSSLFFATSALAQAVTPNAAEPAASALAPAPDVATPANASPVVTQPTAPSTPSVAPVAMAPAGVTSAPAVPASTQLQTTPATTGTAQPLNLNALVGKLSGNNNSQQKLGQVMVIGSIMGCTQKAAGKPATDAFYQQMQGVTKTVEGYCKSGNPAQARATVLDTLNQKHNDPVALAALSCYNSQKANVANLGGQQVAADAEHYARWLKDPATAKAEMQESDVCRNSKKQNSNQ